MKLLTTLTIAAIAVTFNVSAVNAETCEGGSLLTGENGHVYCRSNNAMNWWSAYTWCQAQGRHLASMYEICSTWDGSTGYVNCNLATFNPDSGTNPDMWSATASGDNSAFSCDRGRVQSINRTTNYLALCY